MLLRLSNWRYVSSFFQSEVFVRDMRDTFGECSNRKIISVGVVLCSRLKAEFHCSFVV